MDQEISKEIRRIKTEIEESYNIDKINNLKTTLDWLKKIDENTRRKDSYNTRNNGFHRNTHENVLQQVNW